MLRLTAELADAWNTCWLGRATELPERLAPIHAACAEVGRNPATLEVTVGQIVMIPNSTGEPGKDERGQRFEFSDPNALAEEWRAFEQQGVRHLIVWPQPFEAECLNLVTSALRTYRDGGGT